ncbi:MAG TPA: DUF1232 domain-containing protein [Thermoanaerobaculia bacterium]|nr:DUF1232 domain-containing protein [Thermoanaerobaculia bacterium]
MRNDGDDTELDGFEDPDVRDGLDDLDELERPEPADATLLPPHGDRLALRRLPSEAEVAFVRGRGEVAPLRMLAFYDRLRGRVVSAIEKRGGRIGRGAADVLLLVPDVFMLLARLALDPEVPAATRGLIGGALAYFILPFDLLPEALVGALGYMDDLVLAAAVLTQALGPNLEPRARLYWSGRQELRQVLADVVTSAESLLGESLLGRLERLLARRGVSLRRETERYGERAYDGFEGDPGSELA